MRFGLSDLQELPSLKEFEALAREALGSDEGLAAPQIGDESVLANLPRSEEVGETAARATAPDAAIASSAEVAAAPAIAADSLVAESTEAAVPAGLVAEAEPPGSAEASHVREGMAEPFVSQGKPAGEVADAGAAKEAFVSAESTPEATTQLGAIAAETEIVVQDETQPTVEAVAQHEVRQTAETAQAPEPVGAAAETAPEPLAAETATESRDAEPASEKTEQSPDAQAHKAAAGE
jgi:hypothetical protein